MECGERSMAGTWGEIFNFSPVDRPFSQPPHLDLLTPELECLGV